MPLAKPVQVERPAGERAVKMLVISSDTYPPTRVDVAVLFGEELSRRGHRIDWILQSEAQCDKSYVADLGGGKVWVGRTDARPSLLASARKHAMAIRNDLRMFGLLKSGDYDLIGVKDKFIAGIFAAMAARRYRKRFIYWLSYPFPEDYLLRAKEPGGRHPLLYRLRGWIFWFLLYKIILIAADHVIVQSEQMRDDIAAQGIPKSKMTPVPMGIKTERFAVVPEVEKRELIPEGTPCFLYLGTFRKIRHIDFLVRVLARVRETIPDARLYIVGSGDDKTDEDALLEEAERLGVLEALVLTGQMPQEQAWRYVAEADVCVSPFFPTPILNSTSPTKLVEYMAMGKAVVANDHPEQRLLIQQSGGGYCVPYDEAAFAAAIVKLLQAPEQARAMGALGRRYALRHRSYARIADTVEGILKNVAAAVAGK